MLLQLEINFDSNFAALLTTVTPGKSKLKKINGKNWPVYNPV